MQGQRTEMAVGGQPCTHRKSQTDAIVLKVAVVNNNECLWVERGVPLGSALIGALCLAVELGSSPA